MRYLSVQNFERYQHYRHRNPPWVKLYVKILGDETMRSWPVSTRLLAVLLLCVAGEKENKIPDDVSWLSVEVGLPKRLVAQSLEELLASKFLIPASKVASKDASESATTTFQTEATTETETETEKKTLGKEQRAKREPDELWDALVAELGDVRTKDERGVRNHAVGQLREIAATPEDIHARCRAYRRKWPGITLTASALTKHWSSLEPVAAPAVAPVNDVVRLPEITDEERQANLEHARRLARRST